MNFFGFFDGIYREKFEKIGKVKLMPSLNFDYSEELISNINDFDPDIVHVFIPGAQNPSYFNKLPKKSKKFVTVLCEQKIGFDHKLFENVFFISKYGQEFSGQVDNGVVIRPGYDYNFLEKMQSKKPSLARVSAFCPSKLIDHTMLCCARHRDLHSTVVGEIQDLGYYNNISIMRDELGLKNLKIIANAADGVVEDVITSCDIWHYPTSSEAFCFSMLEAMAAKKPIISYNNGAISEFFDTDDWLAYDIDDLFEKTSKMISLSPSERTAIGRANYMNYLKHNQEFFAATIMSFYKASLSKEAKNDL